MCPDPARAASSWLLSSLRRARRDARARWRSSVTCARRAVRYLTTGAVRIALAATLVLSIGSAGHAWDAERLLQGAQKLGPAALEGARALRAAIDRAAGQEEVARLDTLNQFFNRRIQFREDQDVWGQNDYWASPLETMARGAGD